MKADAPHIIYGNKASLLTLLKWKFLILWFAYSDNREYLQDLQKALRCLRLHTKAAKQWEGARERQKDSEKAKEWVRKTHTTCTQCMNDWQGNINNRIACITYYFVARIVIKPAFINNIVIFTERLNECDT